MKIEDCKSGETTSCEWCDPKTIPLFYAECVRATIDDESQLISVSYCPNCGRKIGEPMTEDEIKLLKEIAAWFPDWNLLYLNKTGSITHGYHNGCWVVPFDVAEKESKAYEVLAPILEKYGEINLNEYRESNDKHKEIQ